MAPKVAQRRVFVVGVGMTEFLKPGAKQEKDYPELAKVAGQRALADACIKYEDVDQVVCSYVYGDSTCGQRAAYELGLTGVPIYNTNNNCASGSTALYMARQFVAGGSSECCLALGFEKMEPGSLGSKFQDRTNPLDKHMEVMVNLHDFTPAPPAAQMFGNAGREHQAKYGSKPEHFAKIAAKNHAHSKLNPYSQFRGWRTLWRRCSRRPWCTRRLPRPCAAPRRTAPRRAWSRPRTLSSGTASRARRSRSWACR